MIRFFLKLLKCCFIYQIKVKIFSLFLQTFQSHTHAMRLLDIESGFKLRNNSIQGQAKKIKKLQKVVWMLLKSILKQWASNALRAAEKYAKEINLFRVFRNEKKWWLWLMIFRSSQLLFVSFKQREKGDLKHQLVEVQNYNVD